MEIKITDKIKIRGITKWLIGVVAACSLIYLAIRHLDRIGAGIAWLADIMLPLLLGVIMAFILNVPMHTGAFLILTVSPLKAFAFIIFLIILQQLEGNLIYPRVVGSRVNLPAMWVLAAVTVGGNLAGPAGMLLGVPAASAAYELLKEATAKHELKTKTPESD